MTLQAQLALQLGALALDAELTVADGEVLALLGPNGAGKSTALRALAGLTPLDDGQITLDGEVLDDPAADVFVPPEERRIGFVFQDYLLFPHMTVRENVAYGLRARGTAKDLARRTAHEWLERVGLAEYAGQRPAALSGGQAQRAALARALATDPRLLLLDEPLAALDAGTRGAVRSELRRHLATFGGMRVLVTHDPVDAHALADRVAVLEGGRIVQEGALAEVTARPRSRYVADLVGVNLVRGTVTGGVLTTTSGAHVVVADAASGPAFAVIRPHAVAIARTAAEGSSVRNCWTGVIAGLDRLGDRVRVSLEGRLPLVAEITVGAMDALALRPGDEVVASVKATEVEVYAE